MNKYKLVGCDLDGTLLNDALEVSPENKLAIEQLVRRGVYFVPITGRALSEMREVADIPCVRYIIFSNGSVIFDKKSQKYTYMCISKETSNFVLDTLRACDSYIVMHHGGKTYANNMDDDEIRSYNLCSAVYELVRQYANKEEDFEKNIYLMDNVESIVVFFKDDKEKELCKEILSKDKRLFVVETWERNLEIFSADAGKDKALKQLAENLDIDMKDIISIGDSGNDVEMTKIAGLGLSASNGSEELKSVADSIVCSNNENVVQYVLSEYF